MRFDAGGEVTLTKEWTEPGRQGQKKKILGIDWETEKLETKKNGRGGGEGRCANKKRGNTKNKTVEKALST